MWSSDPWRRTRLVCSRIGSLVKISPNSSEGSRVGKVVLVVALAAFVAAVFTVTRDAEIGTSSAPAGSEARAPVSSLPEPRRRTPDQPEGDRGGPAVDPWLLPDHRSPPPEADSLSDEWDGLPSTDRVQAQRERFATAVDSVKHGIDVPANLLAAQDALSAMRPELYGTDAGRGEHQGYEAQLDKLEERRRAKRGTR